MATQFSFSEALQLAIEREKESQALYQRLSKKTSNEEIKKIYNFLYSQEVVHEAFFTTILQNTTPEPFPRSAAENEHVIYIIDQLNNTKISARFYEEQLDNPEAALNYAITRETDAIIFYVGLKELMLPEDQEKITEIIWQEARHAIILSNLRHKILGRNLKL